MKPAHITGYLFGIDGRTEWFPTLEAAQQAAGEAIAQDLPVEIRAASGNVGAIWRYERDDKVWVKTPL